jgi:hypothetical protein
MPPGGIGLQAARLERARASSRGENNHPIDCGAPAGRAQWWLASSSDLAAAAKTTNFTECRGPRPAAARHSSAGWYSLARGISRRPARLLLQNMEPTSPTQSSFVFTTLLTTLFSAWPAVPGKRRCLETTIGQGTAPAGRVRALRDAHRAPARVSRSIAPCTSHPAPRMKHAMQISSSHAPRHAAVRRTAPTLPSQPPPPPPPAGN